MYSVIGSGDTAFHWKNTVLDEWILWEIYRPIKLIFRKYYVKQLKKKKNLVCLSCQMPVQFSYFSLYTSGTAQTE